MSQILVKNLEFAYDGSYDNVFENVSFTLDTDWKLGFCGRNGRGKTTFLKLLMGKFEYFGEIRASVDFEYFPFDIADEAADTLAIIYEISPDAEFWQICRELAKLDVDDDVLYRPFLTLSNGERTKVMLAALFVRENSVLLIDEPTNHLDMEARALVARYLNGKSGFIVVSHDRVFLDSCVDHILSINRANIEIQSGNFSSWFNNKELQDRYELERNSELKKEIGRLSAAAKRTEAWSGEAENRKIGFDPRATEKSKGMRAYQGEKSRKMMARSKAIVERRQHEIEEKSKLMKNLEKSDSLKLSPLRYHSELLLFLDNVSLGYGGREVCGNISFELRRGDRVSLRGPNGCGKSSILKLILGEKIEYSGLLSIGSGLKLSYVQQDASKLTGELRDYAEEQGIDESLFKAILRKLDFQRVQFEKDMSDFSAGQKKKVLLARSLCEQAHLYIWDEPLNYIDVLSRMQIEELITEYRPTLLFVEHDRAFCDNIATKIVEM